jgi:tetratricopeptide (TPR) repeat protein
MPPMITTATLKPLLQAALAAQESNDPGRSDALFKQHLRDARNDIEGLALYGMFCLQTGQKEAACYFLHKASRLAPGDAELLGRLGYAHLQNRDPKAAYRAFNAALQIDPSDPLALNGVGLYHMQADSSSIALDAFQRAAARQPDNVAILINLADAQNRSGNPVAAIDIFERAMTIAPRHPPLLLEYAGCLRTAGFPARAIEILATLAPEDRNQPKALLEASRCQRQLGHYARAIESIEALNRLLPETAEYHEEMGNCLPSAADGARRHAHWADACTNLIDAQRFPAAGALLERLLGEESGNASTWNLKGIFHEAQLQHEQAEASFRKAIEIDRSFQNAYPNLATLLEELNRVEEARQVADAGLQLGSGVAGYSTNAYIELRMVSCRIARRQKQLQPALQHLDHLDGLALSENQKLIASFERGMVLHLLEQPAQAMAAFEAGNSQARRRWSNANPGPNKFMAEVNDLLALTRHGWLDGMREPQLAWPPNDSPADPVFLVGFPRSGTTLLNQILESNSLVQTLEEKPTVAKMREILFGMPEGYPREIPYCDSIDLAYLRQAYFDVVDKFCARDDSLVLVDKYPLQIVRVALIHRVFPRARFIFSARHPCDVCLSCFMQNFQPNDAMANFYSLADTVALYIATMELWQAYQDKLPISVHTVRYDVMIDDVEAETKKICDYIGVPWQESQADFATHALRRGKIPTPSYEQVSQPIYRSALGRWEKYRDYFEPHLPALQPWIDKYG